MNKKIILFFQLVLILIFFYTVINKYMSEENKKKIVLNRLNLMKNIETKIDNLPILRSDTENIIEYNNDYNFENSIKKRSFWNLIKK